MDAFFHTTPAANSFFVGMARGASVNVDFVSVCGENSHLPVEARGRGMPSFWLHLRLLGMGRSLLGGTHSRGVFRRKTQRTPTRGGPSPEQTRLNSCFPSRARRHVERTSLRRQLEGCHAVAEADLPSFPPGGGGPAGGAAKEAQTARREVGAKSVLASFRFFLLLFFGWGVGVRMCRFGRQSKQEHPTKLKANSLFWHVTQHGCRHLRAFQGHWSVIPREFDSRFR